MAFFQTTEKTLAVSPSVTRQAVTGSFVVVVVLLALLQSGLRTARFAERTFFSPRQFFAALVAKHNFKLLNFSRISGFVNCRQINKTAPF